MILQRQAPNVHPSFQVQIQTINSINCKQQTDVDYFDIGRNRQPQPGLIGSITRTRTFFAQAGFSNCNYQNLKTPVKTWENQTVKDMSLSCCSWFVKLYSPQRREGVSLNFLQVDDDKDFAMHLSRTRTHLSLPRCFCDRLKS